MMNALRHSNCVLFKLFSGAGRAVRDGGQRRRAAALINNTSLQSFKQLHSQTHTHSHTHRNTEAGGAAEMYSRGQTLLQNQQHESDTFNLDVMVSLLRQENAEDICVIKVPEELRYTEFFIIVSGSSTRHLKAMALYAIKVYKFMKRDCDPQVHLEGKDAEDWMCIDFGSMVVHFMLPESRATYELEKLWTLRSYDEQLRSIPTQRIPADFIYDAETKRP
ncbi:mitochondrial assembly of ribosomal large subunit protein 1 [Salminus brasiliensis]|uniref:mitochondrial assembly of ribosomal large subunit protein 1 n=1 Tax=Salminus brasiliensis TaxID=930266 RepID=UPI003B833E31